MPKEIQIVILNYCDDRTRRLARLACTKWFNIIDYRNFSLFLTTKSSWPQIVDRMSTYTPPITLQFRKNILKRLPDIMEHLVRLTNLAALSFDDIQHQEDSSIEWFKLTSLPNLQSVLVLHYEYSIPLEPLLSLPNLTRFYHNYSPVDSAEKLVQSIRRWTNLENCSFDVKFPLSETGPFESYHTRLTSLFLRAPDQVTDKWLEHLAHLKSLDISFNEYSSNTLSLTRLTALERLVMFGKQIRGLNSTRLTQLQVEEKFIQKTELNRLVNVKKLQLTLANEDRSTMEHHPIQWLTALTALQDLSANNIQHDDLSYLTSSLVRLQITLAPQKPMDLAHLTRFATLKQFIVLGASTGLDFTPVSKMVGLESLQLDVEGRFKPIDFAMSVLSNLTRLSLNRTPVEVSHLPNLEQLVLAYTVHCQFTGFVGLPNLTKLEFAHHWGLDTQGWTFDYTFVSRLTTLKQLTLNTQKCSCQYFSTLTGLKELTLETHDREKDYNYIACLTNLTKLQIWRGIPSRNILQLSTTLQVLYVDLSDYVDFVESIEEEVEERFINAYDLCLGFI